MLIVRRALLAIIAMFAVAFMPANAATVDTRLLLSNQFLPNPGSWTSQLASGMQRNYPAFRLGGSWSFPQNFQRNFTGFKAWQSRTFAVPSWASRLNGGSWKWPSGQIGGFTWKWPRGQTGGWIWNWPGSQTGGSTGGQTGGSTGGQTGGSTGGQTGGSTGGQTGGSTGAQQTGPQPGDPNVFTYLWSFVCSDGPQCSGSGQLVTDILLGPGSGPATVLSLFGTFAGETILGLLPPDEPFGDGWWRNDNLLISLGDELLNDGISGYTASWYFNIYLSDTPGRGDSVLMCRRDTAIKNYLCLLRTWDGYTFYKTGDAKGNFSVEPRLEAPPPVPVPAALPLLGSALAFVGFIGWRRRLAKAAPSH